MTPLLVTQLRFARSELVRALDGVTDEDARRRTPPLNALSWIVGHLAYHEHWLLRAQGQPMLPEIDEIAGYGRPASTPPLAEMWQAWTAITSAADAYLDALTTDALQEHWLVDGQPLKESIGTSLLRLIYHYWYHIGESQAVRQLLGHTGLSDFVGDLGANAPYVPEQRDSPTR